MRHASTTSSRASSGSSDARSAQTQLKRRSDADGIRNIPLNPTGLGVPHGWLAFKLKPVEGRDIPWEVKSLKMELTIHRNGEARSMTLTYDADGNDSMSS